MEKFLVELGAHVQSKISGLRGVVVARSEHINGCNRYYIQPKVDKDGKLPDGWWLDENELDVLPQEPLSRGNTERGGFASRVK